MICRVCKNPSHFDARAALEAAHRAVYAVHPDDSDIADVVLHLSNLRASTAIGLLGFHGVCADCWRIADFEYGGEAEGFPNVLDAPGMLERLHDSQYAERIGSNSRARQRDAIWRLDNPEAVAAKTSAVELEMAQLRREAAKGRTP